MTFKQFLIDKNIPFKEDTEDNTILVDDNLILPYELEFRQLLPEADLLIDYQRYKNIPLPNSSS